MEKLIKKFGEILEKEIYTIECRNTQMDCYDKVIFSCAEESKKIACEFSQWVGSKQLTYYIDSWFNEFNHSLDCTTEELFNNFLKEKYE